MSKRTSQGLRRADMRRTTDRRSIRPCPIVFVVNAHANDLSRAVSDVLKGLQNQKRLRQEDLSQMSGVPMVSLQRYLAGTRSVPIDKLDDIARALDTTAQQVVMDAAMLLAARKS